MKKGVSLIECVIVVAVIAIVFGLLAPAIGKARSRALQMEEQEKEKHEPVILEKGATPIHPIVTIATVKKRYVSKKEEFANRVLSQYKVQKMFKIENTTFWKFEVNGGVVVYAHRNGQIQMTHVPRVTGR